MVPMIVDTIVATKAMVKVFRAASITSLFLDNSQNQWNGPQGLDLTRLPSVTTRWLNDGINPSNVTLALEALKEYSTNPTIGAYRKIYTRTAATKTRGARR